MRKLPTILVAGTAATVAVAGIAAAAIPNGDGSVTACYSPDLGNGVGPLRPVDQQNPCPAGDQRVTLGAAGTAGPVGPAGAAGAVGERGAAGASAPAPQVFETIFTPGDPVTDRGIKTAVELPQTPQKLPISLALPAGTFEVDASAVLYLHASFFYRQGLASSGGPRVNSATCFLNAPGRESLSAAEAQGGGSSVSVTDHTVIKLDAPATIAFGCGADTVQRASTVRRGDVTASGAYGGWARSMRLTAVKVADGTAAVNVVKAIPGAAAANVPAEIRPSEAIKRSDAQAKAQAAFDKSLRSVKGR